MRNTASITISTTVILSSLLMAADARADSYGVTVPATANIFSAGLGTPVAPAGGGAGTLPVAIPILPGQTNVQLSASGSVSQYYSYFPHGPDGLPNYAANVSPYGGISGFITDQVLPLVGVFLSDDLPQLPAPGTLDFSSQGLGRNFLALSPALGQVFFMGDGLTSDAQRQNFAVPSGATRLFLGFPDCVQSQGLPGAYADNQGTLQVKVTVLPNLPRPEIRVSEVELCWNTETNTVYQLQYRSVLTTNLWVAQGNAIRGDGSRFCTKDQVIPGQPQKFYRLVITNSP